MRYFIRVDDMGTEPQAFSRLAEICEAYKIRLNAAAIPNLHHENTSIPSDEIEVHAHGFAHHSHSLAGKKSEYPETRSADEVRAEIAQGNLQLRAAFGDLYFPIFVPPWNRMALEHRALLPELGFKAISTYGANLSDSPIVELNAHFDLHTSGRPANFAISDLLEQMRKVSAEQGHCGLMLHHNHMQEEHFTEFAELAQRLNALGWRSCFMSELLT